MFEDVLVTLGLTNEESSIYLSLLENGPQTATGIAKTSKVKRTYVYPIARRLVQKGLITQSRKGPVTAFAPLSPARLLGLAEEKKHQAALAQRTLEGVLNSLASLYIAAEEKPLISTHEGIDGLKRVYQDIIKTGKDIKLLRSLYDDKRPDLDKLVTEQIEKQVKAGIHTHTITPLEPETKKTYKTLDEKRLVIRHIVKNTLFSLPSQIIIYHEKVAIVTMKNAIIATVIHNIDVYQTFEALFSLLWQNTEREHEDIIRSWDKQP